MRKRSWLYQKYSFVLEQEITRCPISIYVGIDNPVTMKQTQNHRTTQPRCVFWCHLLLSLHLLAQIYRSRVLCCTWSTIQSRQALASLSSQQDIPVACLFLLPLCKHVYITSIPIAGASWRDAHWWEQKSSAELSTLGQRCLLMGSSNAKPSTCRTHLLQRQTQFISCHCFSWVDGSPALISTDELGFDLSSFKIHWGFKKQKNWPSCMGGDLGEGLLLKVLCYELFST